MSGSAVCKCLVWGRTETGGWRTGGEKAGLCNLCISPLALVPTPLRHPGAWKICGEGSSGFLPLFSLLPWVEVKVNEKEGG